MNLLAYINPKKESAAQIDRAKEAVAHVREVGAELQQAVERLGVAVRSNIENTVNRTLAENRRVTGRPRRHDQDH